MVTLNHKLFRKTASFDVMSVGPLTNEAETLVLSF